jgi:TAT (twin-arginine translocation) pathway signal sequence
MKEQTSRRTFLKAAGLGSIAAASLPALLPSLNAQVQSPNGHRIFTFVSFSQAPATTSGVLPRIGMQGAGTFDPDAGWVKGGGNFGLFDQSKPTPKPLIASGFWQPTAFVSYDTKGLGSYGIIQPAILTVLADFPGIGSGLTLVMVCNSGAGGLMTGQDEGWNLLGTPAYGSFVPVGVGITHLSVQGVSIDCGA